MHCSLEVSELIDVWCLDMRLDIHVAPCRSQLFTAGDVLVLQIALCQLHGPAATAVTRGQNY